MSPSKWPAPAERCAIRADERDDWMLGTAFPAARLLLVEEPFPWGPEGLRTSRFDGPTALAVEARARMDGVRVQAIRRSGRSPEGAPRQWMLVDTRDSSTSVLAGTYEEDAELLHLPLDGSHGEPVDDPLYLVCSHGQHDPCCGQRGRPVVAALAALRPDQVWLASHLGGCRFSPTLLVLPLGLMYGRVPTTAAEDLVAATEAGSAHAELLRGRIGVPPPAQAALAYASRELGEPRIRELSLVSSAARDDGSVLVRIDSPQGPFDVTVHRARVDAVGLTCGTPGPSWFVAHRPVGIEPVAA